MGIFLDKKQNKIGSQIIDPNSPFNTYFKSFDPFYMPSRNKDTF